MARSAVRTVALPITKRKDRIAGIAVRALALGLAIAWLALTSLLYLAQANYVADTTYTIQKLEAEKTRWLIRNEQLKGEIARLESYERVERIEKLAVERLGMVPPEKVLYVALPDTPLSPTVKAGPRTGGLGPESVETTVPRLWWGLLRIVRMSLESIVVWGPAR